LFVQPALECRDFLRCKAADGALFERILDVVGQVLVARPVFWLEGRVQGCEIKILTLALFLTLALGVHWAMLFQSRGCGGWLRMTR
jgi:hypothetical protein